MIFLVGATFDPDGIGTATSISIYEINLNNITICGQSSRLRRSASNSTSLFAAASNSPSVIQLMNLNSSLPGSLGEHSEP